MLRITRACVIEIAILNGGIRLLMVIRVIIRIIRVIRVIKAIRGSFIR